MTSQIGTTLKRPVENNSVKKIYFIRYKLQSGFTLIEVILVTILMAVIVGLAMPNFRNTFNQVKLKTTTDDLAYTMRYAQSRAIMKNHPVQLEFDSEHNKYWITEAVDDEALGQEKNYVPVTGRMGRSVVVDRNIKIESLVNNVRFMPNGDIDKAVLYICDKLDCRTISTREQKGMVRVSEGRVE